MSEPLTRPLIGALSSRLTGKPANRTEMIFEINKLLQECNEIKKIQDEKMDKILQIQAMMMVDEAPTAESLSLSTPSATKAEPFSSRQPPATAVGLLPDSFGGEHPLTYNIPVSNKFGSFTSDCYETADDDDDGDELEYARTEGETQLANFTEAGVMDFDSQTRERQAAKRQRLEADTEIPASQISEPWKNIPSVDTYDGFLARLHPYRENRNPDEDERWIGLYLRHLPSLTEKERCQHLLLNSPSGYATVKVLEIMPIRDIFMWISIWNEFNLAEKTEMLSQFMTAMKPAMPKPKLGNVRPPPPPASHIEAPQSEPPVSLEDLAEKKLSLNEFQQLFLRYKNDIKDPGDEDYWVGQMVGSWQKMPNLKKLEAIFISAPSVNAVLRFLYTLQPTQRYELVRIWNDTKIIDQIMFTDRLEENRTPLIAQKGDFDEANCLKPNDNKPKEDRKPPGIVIDGYKGHLTRKQLQENIAAAAPGLIFNKIERWHRGGIYVEPCAADRKAAEEKLLIQRLPPTTFGGQALSVHRPGEKARATKAEDAFKVVVKRLERDQTEEEVVSLFNLSGHKATAAVWLTSNKHPYGKASVTLEELATVEKLVVAHRVLLGICYYPAEKHQPKSSKLKDATIQCFKCQHFGHTVASCKEETDTCNRCSATGHRHKDCTVDQNDTAKLMCANCKGNHASSDKSCAEYKKKVADFEIAQLRKFERPVQATEDLTNLLLRIVAQAKTSNMSAHSLREVLNQELAKMPAA